MHACRACCLPNVTKFTLTLPTRPSPPPHVAVHYTHGSDPEKLSLSVEKPYHLEESSRVGVPDGWNSFWEKGRTSEKAAGTVLIIHQPPPPPLPGTLLLLCGEEQFPRGADAYTLSFLPPTAFPLEPSGPDEARGAKGVRSYLLVIPGDLPPAEVEPYSVV